MGIIDNLRETVSLVQKVDNLELYRQIISLQLEVMALVEENRSLKRRLELSEQLVLKDNAYWRKDGDRPDIPFCMRCWDSESKLIRLVVTTGFEPNCPNCKNFFSPENSGLGIA
jgi:hypothetical protein